MNFAALVYHRSAFLDGQWWLPFSAQIAHLNAAHALVNLVGAGLLLGLFRPWLHWQEQCAALLGGVIGVALVVVLDVHCEYYAGASGLLHGWAAGGAIRLLCRSRSRWVAMALLTGLAVKLILAALNPEALPLWGFPVYAPSHWAGALGGMVGAGLACSSVFRSSTANTSQ